MQELTTAFGQILEPKPAVLESGNFPGPSHLQGTPNHVLFFPTIPNPGYVICDLEERRRKTAPAPGVGVERKRFAVFDSQVEAGAVGFTHSRTTFQN